MRIEVKELLKDVEQNQACNWGSRTRYEVLFRWGGMWKTALFQNMPSLFRTCPSH